LDAYVAQPSGEPIAGLVVIQEAFGVNRHIRSVADGYAKDGFLVLAPALFDRTVAQAVSAFLLLSVYVLLAVGLGQSAKKQGRSAIRWTILGLIINPLFAGIALAIVTGIQAYKQPR
jgi:dienelactone hydrolase